MLEWNYDTWWFGLSGDILSFFASPFRLGELPAPESRHFCLNTPGYEIVTFQHKKSKILQKYLFVRLWEWTQAPGDTTTSSDTFQQVLLYSNFTKILFLNDIFKLFFYFFKLKQV